MRKTVLFTLVCSLLLAVGWSGASAQDSPAASPTAQRIGLQLVDNKSVYTIEDEVNNYENTLGLCQPDGNYKFTAGLLNEGSNHITLYRQGEGENEGSPVARINLQAEYDEPQDGYIAGLNFASSAPSSQTYITQSMLPANWGTTDNGLVWQTNGYAYVAAQGGLTFTVPDGYSNVMLQLIVYVGSNVRGGYFAYNVNGAGWYVTSQVSANSGYTLRTFTGINSGDVISIYGGESSSGSYYLANSPDIELIMFNYIPETLMPTVTVTPTVSNMSDGAWSDESPIGTTATYTVNDLINLDGMVMTDQFSESTATNEHPEHYVYKVDFDANLVLPSDGATGLDFQASADFAAATSTSPTTATFTGPNNWTFVGTNVYTPSAGRCAYIMYYGTMMYRMPDTFLGNSVNVTVTASTGDDGAGDLYVNGVLHTFTAGETYTWTVPTGPNGAIVFKSNGETYSNDFTQIVISSGNGASLNAPRQQHVTTNCYEFEGRSFEIDSPMTSSKQQRETAVRIND